MGSILIRVAIATQLNVGIDFSVVIFRLVPLLHRRGQDRQTLHRPQEADNAETNETQGNQNLDHRRRVIGAAPVPVGKSRGVEAIAESAQHDQEAAREKLIVTLTYFLLV